MNPDQIKLAYETIGKIAGDMDYLPTEEEITALDAATNLSDDEAALAIDVLRGLVKDEKRNTAL